MKTKISVVIVLLLSVVSVTVADYNVIWQEAEQFDFTGKWSNDPQHMDIMGSPYLLATGLAVGLSNAGR